MKSDSILFHVCDSIPSSLSHLTMGKANSQGRKCGKNWVPTVDLTLQGKWTGLERTLLLLSSWDNRHQRRRAWREETGCLASDLFWACCCICNGCNALCWCGYVTWLLYGMPCAREMSLRVTPHTHTHIQHPLKTHHRRQTSCNNVIPGEQGRDGTWSKVPRW